jgi:hypothetical protein
VGVAKKINVGTNNEFQVWQREHLPAELVIQDIDSHGMPLLISRGADWSPWMLLELKRSSIAPARWTPFDEDRHNYAAMLALANRASIPFVILYYLKGTPIKPDSVFSVFHLRQAFPEYAYHSRELMPAAEFEHRVRTQAAAKGNGA